jgi:hypothetical protein
MVAENRHQRRAHGARDVQGPGVSRHDHARGFRQAEEVGDAGLRRDLGRAA